MNIANRITSQMAFNIFSTSINICSLARYFSSSSSPYGNQDKFFYLMWVHTRIHTHILSLHISPLKYTYVRVHGSQSKRDLLDRASLRIAPGRENKVLPNVGKHGAVFTRPEERSWATSLWAHRYAHV